MEERNYSEKEEKLAARILKLYASYCARFWAEKLTDNASFWSCNAQSKNLFQMGHDFVLNNVPYVPISVVQVFKFIKTYEKLASSEIASIVRKDDNIAVVLGYSDYELHPGFTSGVNGKGEPEFFLRQVLKVAGISGVFLDLQNHHIGIKGGKLYLEYHNEKQELLAI